jgi:aspartyl-tRNA(Asn)/glutamyl-tRNA(Gln) amidotransferase subunit C
MDTAPSSSESMKVGYVAHLARLELTEDETARFQPQLDRILEFVRHLQSLDTGAVEPTAHAAPAFNRLREDTPRPGLDQAEVLANAPSSRQGMIIVPRILE